MGSVTKEQNPACWHRVRGKVRVEVRLRGLAGSRVRRALWATVRYSDFIVTAVRTFEDVIVKKRTWLYWDLRKSLQRVQWVEGGSSDPFGGGEEH